MKKILLYLFLLMPALAFAQITPSSGIKVASPLVKNSPTDNTITGYADILNGGYHTGITYHSRDSISATYTKMLRTGMLYYVSGVDSTYRWNGSSWIPVISGGSTTYGLTFNNSGTGDASGTVFTGGVARALSYNSIGALSASATVLPSSFLTSSLTSLGTLTGLTVASTTAASVPFPIMTNTQMLAIASPTDGKFVYNSTAHLPYFYKSSAWTSLFTLPTGGSTSNFLTGVGSVGTFANGLTASGGVVKLGGSLTANTPIGLNGFYLNIYSFSGTGVDMTFNDNATAPHIEMYSGGRLVSGAAGLTMDPYGLGGANIGQTDPSGFSSTIGIDNGALIVTNQTSGGSGLQDAIDYSAYGNDLSYATRMWIKTLARNAANFGITASLADVAHYANPGSSDETYRVGGWINIQSGTGSVTLQVTWTDNHSASKTKYFFVQGTVTAAVTGVDDYSFPTMDFRVKAGTTIQVSTTATGTILYEVGATIQKIIGN